MVEKSRGLHSSDQNCARPFATIQELLQHQQKNAPGHVAIMCPGRSSIDYANLGDVTWKIGEKLRKLGVDRHHRIALVAANGPEMATAIIAIARTAVCVPLYPEFSLDEWHRYLGDLHIDALLTDTNVASAARKAARNLDIPVIDMVTNRNDPAGIFDLNGTAFADQACQTDARPEDDTFVLPTSGTTSRPKAVPLTHANICRSAYNTGASLALDERDRLLNVLPLFHAHGLISGLMSSLAAGSSIVCTPGFEGSAFFGWLSEFQPSWYTAVPTIHQAVLAEARLQEHTPHPCSLRLIRSASASLPPAVLKDLEKAFDVPVIETFGMTEAASQVASNPLPPKPRKIGSVGVAAGPEIAIMDNAGEILAPGEEGEVVLRGPNMTRGYEADPATNDSAWTKGWLRSGDIGFMDHDGYLFISGRKKELINRGGQKIAPREIEDVLTDHADVAEAVAFSIPHERLGEEVAAAVILHADRRVTSRELSRFAAGHLANFKRPRRIDIVQKIPRTATGKIQRSRMAEQLTLLSGNDSAPPFSSDLDHSPLTSMQQALIEIWREVLNVDRIGDDDNFFLLGGDSLMATQVVSRIRTKLGCSLSVADFFEVPTIAELARKLQTSGDEEEHGRVDGLVTESPDDKPFILSYQQRRLYFLDQLGLSSHSYHVVDVVRLRGRLDVDALDASLAAVVADHDVMRTTIIEGTDPPLQQLATPSQPFLTCRDIAIDPKGNGADMITATTHEIIRQPFDLKNGPLFRIQLLRIDEEDHLLVSVFHHLITDGWSQRLFWDNLAAQYRARLDERSSIPDKPVAQYHHYVEWQQAWIDTPAATEQFDYWQTQLRGITPLPLRTDKPRPKTWRADGARLPVTIPAMLTATLRKLGQTEGATLFMVLLAAFQCLLHRYTRHADIAIGSLIANRNRLAFEPLMGMLSNTLMLRTDFQADPTFSNIIRRVRRTTLDAQRHQDLPFEQVLRSLKMSRSLDRNTLFQVLFNLQRKPASKLDFPKLLVEFLPFDPGTARFDLTLELTESDDGLDGWLEYSTELFERSTIARMIKHLQTLLESVAADPGQLVTSIPILPAAEQRKIEVDWQATQAAWGGLGSIQEGFEQQAAKTPDAPAVVCEGETLTFGELNRRANQLAHQLTAMGAKRETLIGLFMTRTNDMVVATLGILKSGAAYVPFDPECPAKRLSFMLDDAGIQIVVTEEVLATRILSKDVLLVRLDSDDTAIVRREDRNPKHAVSPENLAYLLFTSGSTGTPKGVLGTHGGVLNALNWVWQTFPFDRHEVCCHKTSISFGDSIQELFGPLLSGRPIILLNREDIVDPLRLTDALARHRVTRIVLVPSLLRQLVDHLPDIGTRLPDLNLWISSGEALSRDLASKFLERMPDRKLINLYGASEMSDMVTWFQVIDVNASEGNPPIGRPISNMEVYVLDDSFQPTPIGLPGELCVAGLGLTRGYLNRPELNQDKFVDYPFRSKRYSRLYRTGDLARYQDNGVIEHLGRRDGQVQVRGCRVELGEVEAALRSHDGVAQAVVVADDDEPEDLRLTAYIQPAKSVRPMVNELHRLVRGIVPDYMLPSRYRFAATLPLTSSGKVDRLALAASDEGVTVAPTGVAAPRTVTEELLAGIWSQVLKIEDVHVSDNFFELGGHSLLAAQLLARVQQAFGVTLPLRTLFDSPTIVELAKQIDESESPDTDVPPLAGLESRSTDQPRTPSVAQERILDIEQALPGLPVFNLPYAVRLGGQLDVDVLARSLNHVVSRHEALRTTFKSSSNGHMMSVEPKVEISIDVEDFTTHSVTAREQAAELAAKEDAWTPFDIEQAPLFRVRLLKMADDDHVLMFTMHHAIVDGWSMGLFFGEVSEAYATLIADSEPVSQIPPLQYADFADWQRRWLDSQEAADQAAYWQKKLTRLEAPFPAAKSETPSDLSLNVAFEPIHLSKELTDALGSFSRQEGSTPFITLLTGFKTAMRSATGQHDLCIGTILANRSREEFEHVFGPMENIVHIRTRIDANTSFRNAMTHVRSALLEADVRQLLPFEILSKKLKEDSNASWLSSFQIMFVFQNAIRQSLHLPHVDVHPFGDPHREGQPVLPISRMLLTFILRETASGIKGTCIYKQDLLDARLIERLLENYRTILTEAAASAPE